MQEHLARPLALAASSDVDRFLRSHWRHATYRKTLAPMHGVFRGYHVLLALASFTKWAAIESH
jgi:hypothetical protein